MNRKEQGKLGLTLNHTRLTVARDLLLWARGAETAKVLVSMGLPHDELEITAARLSLIADKCFNMAHDEY